MTIRVGFIGAGGIARSHRQSLGRMPEAKIVSICDVDRGRAEAAAEPLGASVHTDFRAMIETEELDAVYICVPPAFHGDAELVAAAAGLHLFIEKPVCLSMDKARENLKAIEEAGVVCAVGYHWRFMSGVDEARRFMQGKPIAMVRGRWIGGMPGVEWWRVREKSGGQAVEQTTHIFDLARYFAGEVRSVYAVGYQGILAARVPDYDIEDASAVVLRFASGSIGSIASADIAGMGYGAALTVFSDDCAVKVDQQGVDILGKGDKTRLDNQGSATDRENAAFLKAVESGDAAGIRSDYADAIRTLEVTLAVNESMRTGEPVELSV